MLILLQKALIIEASKIANAQSSLTCVSLTRISLSCFKLTLTFRVIFHTAKIRTERGNFTKSFCSFVPATPHPLFIYVIYLHILSDNY